MNKKILFIISALVVVSLGGFFVYKNYHRQPMYPFVFTLEDKTKEIVQIYQGSWADTGGSAFDSSGKLQIRKDGKIEDVPMVTEKNIDSSGKITFLLPAGKYFVYIPNPVYDDDLPRDITVPQDTSYTIGIESRH